MKRNRHKDENKKLGNVYDKIFKENAETVFIPLIALKFDIVIKSYRPLPEKLQKTVQREMDFFYEITTSDDEKLLLHIEFQVTDDKSMIYRMAEYHGLAFAKYKLPIKHIVVYLGTGKPKMKSKLENDEIFDGFDVINLHELNTTLLLSSQIPEVVLLALLSDFEPERTETILRTIVAKLKGVCNSTTELKKYLAQLTVLSRLRKLEDLTYKIVTEMPIIYDIEQDYLYKKGIEKGMEKGIEKGIINLLKANMLSIREIAETYGVTTKYVKEVKAKLDKWLDEKS